MQTFTIEDAPAELLAMADKPGNDPFGEQWWNRMQVLAWALVRDRDLVREAGTPAAERGSYFRECVLPDGRKELVETMAGPFTFEDILVEAADRGGARYASFKLAEAAVIKALQAGRLTAYGLKNNEGARTPIPVLQWVDLTFPYDNTRVEAHNALRHGHPPWYDLRFQRNEVLAFWPDPLDEPDDQAPAKEEPAPPAAPEAQCPPRRAHNKRATNARNLEWQRAIDELATKHTGTSHAELCRMLAREVTANPETIRRNTRLPRR
jgi:hypothetical protein